MATRTRGRIPNRSQTRIRARIPNRIRTRILNEKSMRFRPRIYVVNVVEKSIWNSYRFSLLDFLRFAHRISLSSFSVARARLIRKDGSASGAAATAGWRSKFLRSGGCEALRFRHGGATGGNSMARPLTHKRARLVHMETRKRNQNHIFLSRDRSAASWNLIDVAKVWEDAGKRWEDAGKTLGRRRESRAPVGRCYGTIRNRNLFHSL